MLDQRFCRLRALPLIALLLFFPACGLSGPTIKEAEETVRKFHDAVDGGDLETIKAFLGPGAELSDLNEDNIKTLQTFRPTGIQIESVEIDGRRAKVKVKGKQNKIRFTGTVTLGHGKRESKWKVIGEKWMVTTLSGEVETPPFYDPFAGALFKSARKPPKPIKTLTGHKGQVTALRFTPDGKYIVSCSYDDYTLKVWDVESGMVASEVKYKYRPKYMQLYRNGQTVAVSDTDGNVTYWPLNDGKLGGAGVQIRGNGDKFAFSPDGQYIALTGFEKPVTIRKATDGLSPQGLRKTESARVVAFAPKGRLLATAGKGNTVYLWIEGTWQRGHVLRMSKVADNVDVTDLHFSPKGNRLVAGCNDSSIVVFDIERKKESLNFFVTDASTLATRFSPDGRVFVTGHSANFAVHVWDSASGIELANLRGHEGAVHCLDFNKKGDRLASGDAKGTIIVWSAE